MIEEAAISQICGFCDLGGIALAQPKDAFNASQQLELLLGYPWPYAGRPPRHDLIASIGTGDWLDSVPMTLDEIALFEHWFGALFEEPFGDGG